MAGTAQVDLLINLLSQTLVHSVVSLAVLPSPCALPSPLPDLLLLSGHANFPNLVPAEAGVVNHDHQGLVEV